MAPDLLPRMEQMAAEADRILLPLGYTRYEGKPPLSCWPSGRAMWSKDNNQIIVLAAALSWNPANMETVHFSEAPVILKDGFRLYQCLFLDCWKRVASSKDIRRLVSKIKKVPAPSPLAPRLHPFQDAGEYNEFNGNPQYFSLSSGIRIGRIERIVGVRGNRVVPPTEPGVQPWYMLRLQIWGGKFGRQWIRILSQGKGNYIFLTDRNGGRARSNEPIENLRTDSPYHKRPLNKLDRKIIQELIRRYSSKLATSI
jgi:hypothetical protein